MTDFERKVSRTRAGIVILLEQALTTMGEGFTNLGEAIRNEDRDAEARAEYLQSETARLVWASVWHSDVMSLAKVIKEFDTIVDATATGPHRKQVAKDRENFAEGTDRTSIDHLIGPIAELKKHLAKAGFKLSLEPAQGMYMSLVVSRQ